MCVVVCELVQSQSFSFPCRLWLNVVETGSHQSCTCVYTCVSVSMHVCVCAMVAVMKGRGACEDLSQARVIRASLS